MRENERAYLSLMEQVPQLSVIRKIGTEICAYLYLALVTRMLLINSEMVYNILKRWRNGFKRRSGKSPNRF